MDEAWGTKEEEGVDGADGLWLASGTVALSTGHELAARQRDRVRTE